MSFVIGAVPDIAWDGEVLPIYSTEGIVGTLTPSTQGINTEYGSTDGTFGADHSGASLVDGCYPVMGVENGLSGGVIDISLTNDTGANLQLSKLVFDYSRWFNGSPSRLSVIYLSGDLSVSENTLLVSFTGMETQWRRSDYSDYEVVFGILDDSILANGESAVFRLEASEAGSADSSTGEGAFDNIGIIVDPVPFIAWDGEESPSQPLDGISGVVIPSELGVRDSFGSTDGFFGPDGGVGGAAASLNAYRVLSNVDTPDRGMVQVSVTNRSGSTVLLDSLLFDYARWYTDSPRTVHVRYKSGDLDSILDDTLVESFTGIGTSPTTGDYRDFSVSLTGLVDNSLADGERAVFSLEVADANSVGARAGFDNIAITFQDWPTQYGVWVAENGVSGTATERLSDADLDGFDNWTEYVLGGLPNASDAIELQPYAVVNGTNQMDYVHRRLVDFRARGLEYHIEASPDLTSGNWSSEGIVEIGSVPVDEVVESVTHRLSLDGHSSQFVRLRVEEAADTYGNIIVDAAVDLGPVNRDLGGRVQPLYPDDITEVYPSIVRPGYGRFLVERNFWSDANGDRFPGELGVGVPVENMALGLEGSRSAESYAVLLENFHNRGLKMNICFAAVPEWLWGNHPDNDMPVAGQVTSQMRVGHTLPPSDYGQWWDLVYSTVHWMVNVQGYDVIFEVWNEPDAGQNNPNNYNMFWNGTKEELIEMYSVTADAIRAAAPDAKVGGPTIARIQPHLDWFEDLFAHCASEGVPIDFIAWHDYLYYSEAYDDQTWSFTTQAERLQSIAESYGFTNLGLAVTEWSYDWAGNRLEDRQRSAFHGAYIAQSLREMSDNSDYLFATFVGETRSDQQYPNPVWRALSMFSNLQSDRIYSEIDVNYPSLDAFASIDRSTGTASIMVWDYPNPMHEEIRNLPAQEIQNLESEVKTIDLSLQNFAPGEYEYTRYLVDDENNGGEWRDLIPFDEGTLTVSSAGSMSFDLLPYAVSLIEIRPLGTN
ncbi:MAG: GH39 family glycosyl hydrolase [Opitutales bacterium]